MQIEKLFEDFKQVNVAVIGDIMLDTYWWGKVDRISPEAPVPVVALSKKEQRVGGAGNVALNLASLGAKVQVLSVLGKDNEGEQLLDLLAEHQIGTKYLSNSTDRLTTNKIRIISRNQHMMRLDAEMPLDLNKADEDKLFYAFENYMAAENPHIVILEDYNKGVLTENMITRIIALCKKHDVLTAADPKHKNFFAYKGVDIFKPNFKETREGLNLPVDTVSLSVLKDMHVQLREKLQHHISLITLSEKGIFFSTDKEAELIPTHIRTISDVSGAGDTVIAVAALVYRVTKNIKLMAEMANIAGGLVCEEVGTVAINRDKFFAECKNLLV